MTVSELQKALKAAGFDPGPIDGIAGARTRAAVRAFQIRHGLSADGIAGVQTLIALVGPVKSLATNTSDRGDVLMPWMAEARRLMGLKEVSGTGNSHQIMGWAQDLDLDYAGDDVPWCGLFMAHVISATLPDEPLPANPLGARQWLKFGRSVAPQLGAVLVFWRGSKDGWSGHVALYVGEDADTYHVLGGNQSDAVTITRILKDRLLGARWPLGVDPAGQRLSADGAQMSVSTNEA